MLFRNKTQIFFYKITENLTIEQIDFLDKKLNFIAILTDKERKFLEYRLKGKGIPETMKKFNIICKVSLRKYEAKIIQKIRIQYLYIKKRGWIDFVNQQEL